MSLAVVVMSAMAAASSPQTTDTPPASAFSTAAPVDTAALDQATAREDLSQVAISQQTSRVSNNTINGTSVTGPVSIDGNAFQNLQGLSIVNANSGNNVSINAAMTVNLQFTPAP